MSIFQKPARRPSFDSSLPASRLLAKDPGAMAVMAHASEVLKADQVYRRLVAPALGRVSRVANLRTGMVVIHTDHGAAASKLKQQTRYLIDGFAENGVECTAIEVRVQPPGIITETSPAQTKPISERALTSLEQAAAKMRPGSKLRARLEFLVAHAARR